MLNLINGNDKDLTSKFQPTFSNKDQNITSLGVNQYLKFLVVNL